MIIGILILLVLSLLISLWAICKVASDADDDIEREEHKRDKTEK